MINLFAILMLIPYWLAWAIGFVSRPIAQGFMDGFLKVDATLDNRERTLLENSFKNHLTDPSPTVE